MAFNTDTVGFIPPDQSAAVDPNTGTLATDPKFGTFNKLGKWVPTELKMNTNGDFVVIQDTQKRGPASKNKDGSEANKPKIIKAKFNPKDVPLDAPIEPQGPERNPAGPICGDICKEVQDEIQQDINDTAIQEATSTKTSVQLNINTVP